MATDSKKPDEAPSFKVLDPCDAKAELESKGIATDEHVNSLLSLIEEHLKKKSFQAGAQ